MNAFQSLSRDYRSNDGFKLGDRIVLNYIVSNYGMGHYSFNYNADDRLKDIDRCMHVLDGKPEPGYDQGLVAALRGSISGRAPATIETPYWRAKWFKNGNAHLWPLRDDLIDKANRIIAEHFGATLAGPPGSKEWRHDGRETTGTEDFFPTSPEIADRMVKLARIEPGQIILEPSAGEGGIACRILRATPGPNALTCFEINHERIWKLRRALHDERQDGVDVEIRECDFLQTDHTERYGRIIMNPPWSKEQDIQHVLTAFQRLSPTGRLVAIVGAGSMGRQSKLGQTFREMVEARGYVEALPEGAFKEAGTMARGMIVVMDKPAY